MRVSCQLLSFALIRHRDQKNLTKERVHSGLTYGSKGQVHNGKEDKVATGLSRKLVDNIRNTESKIPHSP